MPDFFLHRQISFSLFAFSTIILCVFVQGRLSHSYFDEYLWRKKLKIIFLSNIFSAASSTKQKSGLGSIGNPYVSKDVTGICKFCNMAKTRGFSQLLQTKTTVSPDFGVYFRLYKIKSVLSDGQLLFFLILNFVVPGLFRC